ncbi:MAG: RdgB/HAM1 family non-canonical purine NTP pyrophosphatase [Actinomycetes bacterium]
MRKLIIASRNTGKITEFQRMMAQYAPDVQVMSLLDFSELPDVEETGTTLRENAALKAIAITQATGTPCLADDSGIFIDALNGDPGVYSARWSGIHGDDAANNAKVLRQIHELEAGGPVSRKAQFRCVVALSLPAVHTSGETLIFEEGEMPGHIIDSPRGEHGFGYDPIFVPEGFSLTSAELSAQEKDRISHRGEAMRKIFPRLTATL